MFNTNFDITGIHANYLKDLCELRGNVADKDQHSNFKIFKAYIDAYILCPLIGYQYSRKGKMGSAADGDVGILAEQIIKRSQELKYVYQILIAIVCSKVKTGSRKNGDRRVSTEWRIAAKSVVVTERACVVRSELRIMITQEHLGRRKQ